MARRVDDVARLKRQADKEALCRPRREALQGHRSAIKELSSKLPKGVPTELSGKLGTWAERFERALQSDDRKTAQSLVSVADI